MSTDYAEFERAFLASLKEDTGRDLDEWMVAIAAQNLPHRNDIIDWLRHQGFMFSRASWLERIHNNDGQPIYAVGYVVSAGPPSAAAHPAQADGAVSPPAQHRVEELANARTGWTGGGETGAPLQHRREPPQPAVGATPAGIEDPAALDAAMERAKAYRPLARYVIERIRQTVPDTAVGAEKALVTFSIGEPFAVLALSARELRLGLDLGERPWDNHFSSGKIPGAPQRFAHVAVLTDARQVTMELLGRVRLAAEASRSG